MLRMIKILTNNRGIALLITISVTTILVAAALEYNRRARFEVIYLLYGLIRRACSPGPVG
jgi:hypothetical protein